MWLVIYKPTQLVLQPEYQQYYTYKDDALQAIDDAGLEQTDCIACPVFDMETMRRTEP